METPKLTNKMVEKFIADYDALSAEEKKSFIEYILKDPEMRSIIEEQFSKLKSTSTKGLFTGPVNTSGKCPHCGEIL